MAANITQQQQTQQLSQNTKFLKASLTNERLSVWAVIRQLAEKNNVNLDHKWSIVEQLPQLYMGEY